MSFILSMPKLSPTMETGTIVKWHKKIGEHVEPEELLLEVSTDKATVEYHVLDGGWLKKILVEEGGEAKVNDPIAFFTEKEGESFDEKEFAKQVPVDLKEIPGEEDIVSTDLPSVVSNQKDLSLMAPKFQPESPLLNYQFMSSREFMDKRIKASPLAKKLAKENGLDLTTVKGSGPGGRIICEDLTRAQKCGPIVFGSREIPKISPGSYEEVPLNPVQKVISRRLQDSKTFIPHFYISQTIDAEPLYAMKEQMSNMEVSLSYNDFVLRACALSLRLHPEVNSGFNSVSQSIIRFKTIDVSVAVSVSDGLITPIIRHADFKNLGEIAIEVRDLAKKARDGKLLTEEFKGGSFTISNLGMHGISRFQAIINPPQAAILAVGGIQTVPVVKNGNVVAGKTMDLTLSVDHRVINGVEAAKFIKTLQKYLENPAALLV